MERFEAKTIDEITETLIDYRGKTPPKSNSGIRLVKAKVIKDGFVQDDRIEYIADETYDSWMHRGLPKKNDIVLTTEAPLGEVAQLRTIEKIALAQRVILLRGNPNVIDQQYYYQALKSPYVQAGLQRRATGTTVLGIKQSELRQVEIPYYPITTQRKIATILSAYDDLIENNLRRIKILEEMAQNLYREWFVKFRFPGHEKVKFKDSSLGKIPEGWAVKKLGEILELNYGKALKQEERKDGNIPVYGSSGVVGHHDQHFVDGPGIIVGRKGNVGSVYWSDIPFYPIDTVYFVKSKIPLRFLYYDLQTKNFLNNDAAVPGLNRNQAYSLETIVPSTEILKVFCDFANSYEAGMAILRRKNDVLRRTRDLLLPKLISGELDISELDISIPEEVAA
ncbi:MAG: restriction endonuclease subunit S [Deltaproteobacteria bacterium]|nr:restriction endonuclease subunit S [Deltaproteobacteria bacterium]